MCISSYELLSLVIPLSLLSALMKIYSFNSFFLFSGISFLLMLCASETPGQDKSSVSALTRLSFYSTEENSELLLFLPPGLQSASLDITLSANEKKIGEWNGYPGKEMIRIPFGIKGIKPGERLQIDINRKYQPAIKETTFCEIVILTHKPNEVKFDRLTGGMIVNQRQFFPFGFYCYSPVYPTLPEEEVVKGFNMISPYQKIIPETLAERKAYMDRCAQLGMKVHYNLLSVSGGGGVNSTLEDVSDEEKRKLLMNEIKTFMDHPALLAWYISDEPNGNKVDPDKIEEIYRTVKAADPWHPVSVVFMAPFTPARKYAAGVDIVMADPYPVPDFPVTMAGDATDKMVREFHGKKPVWIVPQTFGGGELWSREPTSQEIRSMTWQAVINGATGIQFFIRKGLNGFPKSTAAWNECGKMALEINSLIPWLLSDEVSVPVTSSSKNILVTSRVHNGELVVMAVNRINEPLMVSLQLGRYLNGKADVLFENRKVNVSGGSITDYIQPFGSQVFKIILSEKNEEIKSWKGNLAMDPGFEDITSAGVPAACYAWPGTDRGATYFTDPREHAEGNYSLRLITPADDKGAALRFFPVKVKAGSSYIISVLAKADPEQRIAEANNTPQLVEIGMGEFGKARFVPGKEWKQYITIVSIPSDTLPEIKTNVTLKMPGQGVAWFDMLQVIEDPLTKTIK
jgi:hypothetical protein